MMSKVETEGAVRSQKEHIMNESAQSRAAQTDIPDDEDLLTIGDIVARTKKHRATIYRWIDRGIFPAGRQMGDGTRLWTRREYRDWVNGAAA